MIGIRRPARPRPLGPAARRRPWVSGRCAALAGSILALGGLLAAAEGPPIASAAVPVAQSGAREAGPPAAGPEPARYDNTLAKDFIMDAPWRIRDADTPIPITIVLKDCDVDDIRELHWIRCRDVTGGGAVPLWEHDFDDERIGDDASEANYWSYITLVTENHPALPDGTPLTPANLGYAAGDAIALEVSVYYRDDWFNYTETRRLRVRVGGGPFPWPAGWYGGDTHYHSMYTNNIAEFGAPLPAVRLAAEALGLHWLTVTDHSCDLDETGDGSYSYATHEWEYTIQGSEGTATHYRDVFAHGSSWGGLGADVAELDGPGLRLCRGVEINLASIDGDSYQKTLHALFYDPDYIASPLSGAFGERPVTPALPAGLDQLAAEGFAYASHPLSDLSAEWGGIDWGVNGARWGDEDLAAALEREGFRGLEAFNTRETRRSSDQNDPWADFDAGAAPAIPYPTELLEGIALWDALLRASLEAGPAGSPRRIFLAGGSDAHGDFNYATYFGLDSYATDNAIGKVQTIAYVPGDHAPGNLPPMSAILDAYRAGRTVVSDGPFLEIGIDRSGDGDWYDAADLMIGSVGELDPASAALSVRWASLPEFGEIAAVRVWAGDPFGMTLLAEWDPSASGQGLAGESALALGGGGLAGPVFLRADALTDDGDAGHRAYTNPIWLRCAPSSSAPPDEAARPARWEIRAPGTLFAGAVPIECALARPGDASLDVLDAAGRLVRRMALPAQASSGWRRLVWDARDAQGREAPRGLYHLRLSGQGGEATARIVLVTR